MAIIKNGPNGRFSGKVGNIIGYQWRGIDVIRGLPRESHKKCSDKQLANQQKMTIMQGFLQLVIPFIRVGFKKEADARAMSAFNVAMSYNKKHSITGEYPDQRIDYSQMLVSMGNLPGIKDATAGWTDEGLTFSWADNSGETAASSHDHLLVLAFFPEHRSTEYLFNGANRGEGHELLQLQKELIGQPVHIYASFITYDQENISDSYYLEVK